MDRRDGRAADPAEDRRDATIVRQDGHEIAAILHEPDVPLEVVQLGARITAGQLDAELATTGTRPGRSGAGRDRRLVQAGDRAALVLAAEMTTARRRASNASPRTCTPIRPRWPTTAKELQEVTANVRAVSHGLVPRELEEGGLAVVLGGRCRYAPPAARGRDHRVPPRGRRSGRDRREEADAIVVTRRRGETEAAARTAALGGRIDGTVATIPVG